MLDAHRRAHGWNLPVDVYGSGEDWDDMYIGARGPSSLELSACNLLYQAGATTWTSRCIPLQGERGVLKSSRVLRAVSRCGAYHTVSSGCAPWPVTATPHRWRCRYQHMHSVGLNWL